MTTAPEGAPRTLSESGLAPGADAVPRPGALPSTGVGEVDPPSTRRADASCAPSPTSAPTAGHALLVDADPLLARLIEEWLATEGLATHTVPPAGGMAACRLVIVDLPYPRRCGVDSIRAVASRHPGVPIIALSPTIFASVDSCGTVSRALGVDCVLAKPTTRERLLAAVRRFVR